jgi:hypothetical protein
MNRRVLLNLLCAAARRRPCAEQRGSPASLQRAPTGAACGQIPIRLPLAGRVRWRTSVPFNQRNTVLRDTWKSEGTP